MSITIFNDIDNLGKSAKRHLIATSKFVTNNLFSIKQTLL